MIYQQYLFCKSTHFVDVILLPRVHSNMAAYPPVRQGLYDPRNEHDSCGMGVIVNLSGHQSHETVRKGLEILINLTHRGACPCDPETGHAAGILTQVPH